MVTLSDIAKMANVSKSTVSRYLNNGPVSKKTRDKIEEIIKETNYEPNILAQSLKAQQSHLIGVIIPRYDSPSMSQVLKGIDEVAYAEKMQLMIMNSNLDLDRTKENIRVMQRQKVGAILLSATMIDEELAQQIKTSKTPILLIGQTVEGIPSYTYQDYEAGQIIAQHAIDLGHRHLLFVGVTEEDYSVGVLRKKGFYDVAEANGATVEFIETEFTKSYSYEQALEYLPRTKATYIAAATDHIALGIMNAGFELGIEIPREISVSGFGGYSETRNVMPHITTVQFPFYKMGERIVGEAIAGIKGKPLEDTTTLPVHLNSQGSTAKLGEA